MILKKGISFLLIGLYSIVLLHNFVPHSHDQTTHENNQNHSQSAHHHSHSHDHSNYHDHSHDSKDESSTLLDVVSGFFGGLAHVDLGKDHFELYTLTSEEINCSANDFSEKVSHDFNAFDKHSDNAVYSKERTDINDPPGSFHSRSLSKTQSLRGPPVIS